jgi:AcrR family transcriptional regulator
MASGKRGRGPGGDEPASGDKTRRAGGTHPSGDAIRDLVVEKVTERINTKLSAKLAANEKFAARAAVAAEVLQRATQSPSPLDVWTRPEPHRRRGRFTRDEIAAAAIRIVDTEGLAALSMRRLAAELDAGTMTLYHYVRTKDELLALVSDAVMGEIVLPPDEPMPKHWRDALTVIAERGRASLGRHPWVFDIQDDPPIGPNSVRHFDQTLEALASLPLPLGEKLEISSAVDELVFGHALMERHHLVEEHPGFDDEMLDYVKALVDTGEYPQLAALAEDPGIEEAWTLIEAQLRDPNRFRRSLERLLDGIEASLPG